MSTRHGDPGAPPATLADPLLGDKVLADMLAAQGERLIRLAVTSANFTAFERQSHNPLYYKTALRRAEPERAAKAAAFFRRIVWSFVQYSPQTRAREAQREQQHG